MADVDNGGGPPTSQLVPDGASNAIFPDISEDARTGGLVEVRHLHGVLRNTDTDALLGANIIISEPPDDPGVGFTLIKSPSTFAVRTDLVALLESTSQPGAEFSGYLLENHTAPMRSINIAQRPGVESPSVNTTLYIVENEGLPSEKFAFVRVRRVTVSEQTFSEIVGSEVLNFQVQIAACELFSPLGVDFAGSPASRLYARNTAKALIRRVNFSDAGTFYSASRLTEATAVDDVDIKVESVYTQIVPNTRTETPLLNQRPGGTRQVTLTDSQGSFAVSAASHTGRMLITETTQGYTQTFKMVPPPAPNSIAVSFAALGNWQTAEDDGAGNFTGSGSGTVLYSTGDGAITMDALPDYNTYLLWQWADTAPFVNNCPSGPVIVTTRPPEFEIDLAPGFAVSGSTVTWPSGGVTKTATADAAGALSGHATGSLVSALGKAYIRPSAMPDAGASFTVTHQSRPTTVQSFAGASVDAGGFVALSLSAEPVPGTVTVNWVTARTVSASSGADLTGASVGGIEGVTEVLNSANLIIGTRYQISNSTYTQTTTSSTSDTVVTAHQITDDAAGGFGAAALGSIGYAAKAISLRLVTQGATVTSYKNDHETASAFSGGAIIRGG